MDLYSFAKSTPSIFSTSILGYQGRGRLHFHQSSAGIGEQLQVDGGDTEPGENDAAGESGISVYPRTTHDIPMTGLTYFWFESSGLQSKWPLADSQSLLTGGQLTQCYG